MTMRPLPEKNRPSNSILPCGSGFVQPSLKAPAEESTEIDLCMFIQTVLAMKKLSNYNQSRALQ